MIKNLADRYGVDVFMFAECEIPPADLLKTLNQDTVVYEYAQNIGCQKITFFTRFSTDFLRIRRENSRMTIRHLALPGLKDVLLGVLHLPSKLYWRDASQSSECYEVSRMIQETELQVGHSRTILVGDFNMNPFEEGFVSAVGLNAVMCKGIAQREARTVQGKLYPFFYNPMWSHIGDETPGPPGTYYRSSSEHVNYFWNAFDQVLVRPHLLRYLDRDFVEVLKSDGVRPLLTTNGLPDSSLASDHLPILFRLNL